MIRAGAFQFRKPMLDVDGRKERALRARAPIGTDCRCGPKLGLVNGVRPRFRVGYPRTAPQATGLLS